MQNCQYPVSFTRLCRTSVHNSRFVFFFFNLDLPKLPARFDFVEASGGQPNKCFAALSFFNQGWLHLFFPRLFWAVFFTGFLYNQIRLRINWLFRYALWFSILFLLSCLWEYVCVCTCEVFNFTVFRFFCESCSADAHKSQTHRFWSNLHSHFPSKIVKFLGGDWYLIFPVLERSAGTWDI